jgi:hypothetical protein
VVSYLDADHNQFMESIEWIDMIADVMCIAGTGRREPAKHFTVLQE